MYFVLKCFQRKSYAQTEEQNKHVVSEHRRVRERENLRDVVYINRRFYIGGCLCLSMDNRSRHSKIFKIFRKIESDEIKLNYLRSIIMVEIGSSERVIHETLKIILELGMMTEIEHLLFKINWERIKELELMTKAEKF